MSVTPLPITVEAARDLLLSDDDDLVGYSRESTNRLLGIFGQDQEIIDWAEREGYRIVGQAMDNGVHGLSGHAEREGFTAVVEMIESGKAAGVVAERLDRIGRNFPVQDAAVQRIWEVGGRVFTTDYGEWKPDRPGDPQWRLRRDYARMAEDEIHALLTRMQTARRRKMAHGGFGGGHRYHLRYGVELVRINGVSDYRPVPAEQEVIRRIVAACPNGAGYDAMAKLLNAEGVPTRTGAPWRAKVVRDLALRGPDKLRVVEDAPGVLRLTEWRKRETG